MSIAPIYRASDKLVLSCLLGLLSTPAVMAEPPATHGLAPVLLECPGLPFFSIKQSVHVSFDVVVGVDGLVRSAKVSKSSGSDQYDAMMHKNLAACRYRPGYAGGVPVEARTVKEYKITVHDTYAPLRQETKQLADVEKAAAKGEAESQYLLGEYHRVGTRDWVDLKKSALWHRKAAEQGHAGAQFMLSQLMIAGTGARKDSPEVVSWLQKAAAGGNPDAQNRLGAMHEDGFGVPKDLALAAGWYAKAADQGHALGQYNLGQCYELGLGVAPDRALAERWYAIAEAQGDLLAHKALAALRNTK